MKLSILDQSPISYGHTPQQALNASMELAKAGERLGYERYWIAEHHNFSGLTCSAPEVMLGVIGASTKSIRIGAGAVLLPHYKPYRVAETFNMLATLFPDRIDLGIGRAPGGSAEASMALSDNYLEQVRRMPASIKELLHFLYNDFPADHMFSKVSASPVPKKSPDPWILGTSEKSAVSAAENGVAYAFGHFMSDKPGQQLLETYRDHFQPGRILKTSKSIVAVSVVCAETTEKASELALPVLFWRMQNQQGEGGKGVPSIEDAKSYCSMEKWSEIINESKDKMIIGTPNHVKEELLKLQERYNTDEMMIVTTTHRYEDRIRSYELLAEEMINKPN
ncbi:LLM class flavin-dependent oxidoreductase [Fictibacillus sp. BK138]|uniref:LLM class flavin-dependent oxidoreductase n=1 Tax=Fictibacillus sp. BK138 TaxID=2512121 RepID=UPI001028F460|nr:LLM class flavin-dependent oxidoreductase [Fictibacillus sp. BK138]RZT21747.1 luciferase family oxidoreductase group 1 [Fictibacillus sp. BK138]